MGKRVEETEDVIKEIDDCLTKAFAAKVVPERTIKAANTMLLMEIAKSLAVIADKL